ncbi:MAG: pentapeptide repeat-containing protein [Cyanobacteria bacterium P01_D01_bin.156]
MVQEIAQRVKRCVHRAVALAGVTACVSMLAQTGVAQALDVDDLQRVIDTKDCPGCNLGGADLRRLDLTGANLEGANLKNANLFYAVLDGANLSGADLRYANLAYVSAAPIVGVGSDGEPVLTPAEFIEADFENALMNYADFSGADMVGADFEEAYIFKTRFVGTQLQRTNFDVTFVHDVDLTDANLCGSTYWGGNDYRRACSNVPISDLEE